MSRYWVLFIVAFAPIVLFGREPSGTATKHRSIANASSSYLHLLTGDDGDSDKLKWDRLYRKTKGYVFGRDPAVSLLEHYTMLPVGRVLDIGMGEGRNAVFLAKRGFKVEGVDISPEAVRKAKMLAKENGTTIRTVIADLAKYQIEENAYEVILVYYFLPRKMVNQIVTGLKPCGMLVFESHTVDQLKYDKRQNRDYLLAKGELETMFKSLQTQVYRETDNGKEAIAFLLARKPAEAGQKCDDRRKGKNKP